MSDIKLNGECSLQTVPARIQSSRMSRDSLGSCCRCCMSFKRTLIASSLFLMLVASIEETSQALTRGPMSGAFFVLDLSPTGDIPAWLTQFERLGFDTIITSSTMFKQPGTKCGPGAFYALQDVGPKLDALMAGAQQRGMKVYLGLISSGDDCSDYDQPANHIPLVADLGPWVAELNRRFGSHPALGGWYIPDEPSIENLGSKAGHFKVLVQTIRKHSTKPVLVAPYLAGGTDDYDPATTADKARKFRDFTGVDIQVWQDSVGVNFPARGLFANLGWAPGATVRDYFKAIAGAIGSNGLWADIELFNPNEKPRVAIGGGYKAASLARLTTQMASVAASASKVVSFVPQYHMATMPSAGVDGRRLYEAYRAYFGITGASYHATSAPYTWFTPPPPSYPDSSGRELTDMVTGDPWNPRQSGWVGVVGDVSLRFDLGTKKRVDWVAVHLLHKAAWGIKFPTQMWIWCSADQLTWNNPLVVNLSDVIPNRDHAESEYTLGNPSPLGKFCRSVHLHLINDSWTFLDEVEILAGPPLSGTRPVAPFSPPPLGPPVAPFSPPPLSGTRPVAPPSF